MVDNDRSSSAGFGNQPDNDSNADKYTCIWFYHLAKFHMVTLSNTWNYEKDQRILWLKKH
jgi:hypothetical protein